jgi:hypothetical protein
MNKNAVMAFVLLSLTVACFAPCYASVNAKYLKPITIDQMSWILMFHENDVRIGDLEEGKPFSAYSASYDAKTKRVNSSEFLKDAFIQLTPSDQLNAISKQVSNITTKLLVQIKGFDENTDLYVEFVGPMGDAIVFEKGKIDFSRYDHRVPTQVPLNEEDAEEIKTIKGIMER